MWVSNFLGLKNKFLHNINNLKKWKRVEHKIGYFDEFFSNKNINRKLLSKKNKIVILKFLLKSFNHESFYKLYPKFLYKILNSKFLKRTTKARLKKGHFKKYYFKKLFFEFFSSFSLRVDFFEKLLRSKKNKKIKLLNIKKKYLKSSFNGLDRNEKQFFFSKKSKNLYGLKNSEQNLNVKKSFKSLFFLRFSRSFIKKVFFLKKRGFLKKFFLKKKLKKFLFRQKHKKKIFFRFSRFFWRFKRGFSLLLLLLFFFKPFAVLFNFKDLFFRAFLKKGNFFFKSSFFETKFSDSFFFRFSNFFSVFSSSFFLFFIEVFFLIFSIFDLKLHLFFLGFFQDL